MLDNQKLRELLTSGFQGHEKDFSPYLSVLGALGVKKGAKIIDFGWSWGYGAWQLTRAGYDVQGLEISVPRSTYGREKLKLNIVNRESNLSPEADVFFSSHVLEHLPNVSEVIRMALSKLKKGGFFIAFTPNGSDAYRSKSPKEFHTQWGKVHPNCLTDRYYKFQFPNEPILLMSNPYHLDEILKWDKKQCKQLMLSGSELCIVSIKVA